MGSVSLATSRLKTFRHSPLGAESPLRVRALGTRILCFLGLMQTFQVLASRMSLS